MNLDAPWLPIANALLALVVLALILYRQLSWRRLSRMVRVAVIVIVLGTMTLPLQLGDADLTWGSAVTAIVLIVAVSLAGGWIMGRFAEVSTGPDGEVRMRGGWLGVALWLGFIAVRIGMDLALAAVISPEMATATGLLLISIGLARLTSTRIAARRAAHQLSSTVDAGTPIRRGPPRP